MDQILKNLAADKDGMATYEYIVNNVDNCIAMMPELVKNLLKVDISGQFLASSARFLHSIGYQEFEPWIPELVEGAIAKDREHKYIWSLLEALWGPDYRERAEELQNSDNNFRRIYKRLFPAESIDNISVI